jgi:hypothetical protein
MQMIEGLEGFEESSKLGNSQSNANSSGHSKTFSKKHDSKSMRMDAIDNALEQESDAIKQQIAEIDKKNGVLKKIRVNTQKQIFEIEKKLNFVEEEMNEEQPAVENLEELDLNKEATLTNKR